MRSALSLSCLALLFVGAPVLADDYLMFGPSLAVYLEEECDERGACRTSDVHGTGTRGDFSEDESHFAMDAGHNVTIVDDAEWAGMTTQEFAAFDAIVIGDAGCDFDEGERLQTLVDTRAVWSPAVTGHLFMHTFDNVYHYNNNSPDPERGGGAPDQFQAMRDLAVDGMEFAASAGSTGLYYANGCRDLQLPEKGERGAEVSALEFLGDLVGVNVFAEYSGDDALIQQPAHPSMQNLDDAGLSGWGSSFHALFDSYEPILGLVAIGDFVGGVDRGGPDTGDIIIASTEPLGGSGSVLPIPTVRPFGLAAFALLLGALGWFVVARRV